MLNWLFDLLKDIGLTIVGYLKADWAVLLVGILLAVVIKVYFDANQLKRYLERNAKMSIPASIAFGAFTPLCACGTMAVILSMFVTAMPWGPVLAFLISSPLTSPSEFVFETAFFGGKFAMMVLLSSIGLGLAAGILGHLLDTKTNFFKGQFRLLAADKESTLTKNGICCSSSVEVEPCKCLGGGGQKTRIKLVQRWKLKDLLEQFIDLGLKKVLFYFIIFIAVGRIVELTIPHQWILQLFSGEKQYSVVLGATIGLPLYISGPASLPLMKSFMTSGAGQGALLAFLIAGKATGVPVIAGLSTILKKKALFFYVAFIYFGAIVCGYLFQLALNLGL